ncbi:MAG TPA: OprD family outer membrane porin, partial [Burkholderiales bacterium]|nr:OprD family outer membrane porin [Burkholderiales bacterium]
MLRFSQFSRSKPNDSGPAAEAAGLGGWLFGETGEYRNFLSFGGAIAYVAPVSAPDGHGGNFILKDPNQDGYSVVGVAFAKARYEDHSLTVGRISPQYSWSLDGVYRFYNRYDGAFVGRRDVRAMIPLAYEGASVQGKFASDTVRYYGGFMHSMKQINDTSFKNIAQAALLPGDSNGMPFGGAQWKITKDLMLQGGYQQAENILDMGWVDLDYVYRLDKDKYLRIDVQYLHQQPTGNNNLGAFSNSNRAAYFEARWWPAWIPYAAIGRNTDGDELRSPFSLGPSYLVQRIGENAKAGEHTWILGSTFDFAAFNLPGLAFDVSYGQ